MPQFHKHKWSNLRGWECCQCNHQLFLAYCYFKYLIWKYVLFIYIPISDKPMVQCEGGSSNHSRKGCIATVWGNEFSIEVISRERDWSVGGHEFVTLNLSFTVDNWLV